MQGAQVVHASAPISDAGRVGLPASRQCTLQDGCPADFSDHASMSYSPRALFYVQQALDPAALGGQEAPCAFNPPIA